ncbi:MAG: 16S rRNA (guanine(527)-N(7))-methyltransferase RsmG [Actinomycetota bacterium]|nr:16S rRNA (guanine(527)-N(7))-methyltransferase RsmG [Actinomycetota bacterium]
MGVNASAEQAEALAAFQELLKERAVPLGMIGRADASRLKDRHIVDCARAAPIYGPRDRRSYDLGSGAGLPGIVLAVLVPWCSFVLIEARSRRAAFLELAVERLGLPNATVMPGRVEDLPEPADVITARAFAPLDRTWRLARPLLSPGGRLVYFAGAGLDDPGRAASAAMRRWGTGTVEVREVLERRPPLVIMGSGDDPRPDAAPRG